ncbi:hypothetical protein GCM10018966_043820 [Streptomyces yanii]
MLDEGEDARQGRSSVFGASTREDDCELGRTDFRRAAGGSHHGVDSRMLGHRQFLGIVEEARYRAMGERTALKVLVKP